MSSTVLDQLSRLNPLQNRMVKRALTGDALARLWLVPEKVNPGLDAWQKTAIMEMVTRQHHVIMCCSRGAGKTEVFSAASYVEACTVGGFAMVLSRSDRQALRVIQRTLMYHRRLQLQPLVRENMHELVFANGGRVLALPCSGDTIVGEHGITLMGIDEAAKIKDQFYALVSPMLAVSEAVTGIKPRLALLSTPYGCSGFFWDEWDRTQRGQSSFKPFRTTWRDCPRIKPEFIEEERRKHGDFWVRQEYETQFLSFENCFFDMDQHSGLVAEDGGEQRRFWVPPTEDDA